MELNTISGRTYNDLAQYPVFPWILSDYTSETIDLNDPSIYRDLSKPIGALNESRLEMLRERFENFVNTDEQSIPPFLFGSHYSNPGIVLFYLVRMEPFCTHFLTMQGGYFDIADRMFTSMQATWDAVLQGPADFKELTPEFFTTPEILLNLNNFDLGTRQNGTKIADVILPPWAKGSPKEFVKINLAALESGN